MLSIIKKYRHGVPIALFSIFYTLIFYLLEHRSYVRYHIIHTVFDDYIPFCEYFIVPYLLWFPYMILTVLYFIFINKNKKECSQLTNNMIMGMSIFLIISCVYPNAQHLRPTTFIRDNLFVDAVKHLYKIDTPTNILPSIHVFNSLAIHVAIISSDALKNKKWIHHCSLILTILIILSTMFLKQHSFVDVSMGATLALAGYLFFYSEKIPFSSHAHHHEKKKFNKEESMF